MRRQGWYPVNSHGPGVSALAVPAFGGWRVGLCRPGMAIFILSFGATYGKAFHQPLFSISPSNSQEPELIRRRGGRTEAASRPPRAALFSEHLGVILPSLAGDLQSHR